MFKKILKSVAVMSLASGIAVTATTGPVQSTSPSQIIIALEAPLTGEQSSNGQDQLRGARLAAAQLNAAGGVLGKRIKIVAVDDKADPGLAATSVTKAVKAGADFVVGPYNSSVGVINLPLYVKRGIFPMRMTSSNETEGFGATTQPMNSQISPAEIAYISSTGVKTVVMLVDPSEYTASIANQTRSGLQSKGITVTQIAIAESDVDFTAQVTQALAVSPDMIYSSTYYPQGSEIAKELLATSPTTRCFMGLANVDPAFVAEAGLAAAQNCVFSGVPAAPQLPTAKAYTQAYVKAYKKQPGVWGAFTYDSVNVLARAIAKVGTTDHSAVKKAVLATKNYKGATGTIGYSKGPGKQTGNRLTVPVEILSVNSRGTFVLLS
jgi:branched-chain amino acid transport system substrate-binding protein